jgi:uncharacterized membrane protein YphA (DoxX/SURF4 family)
MPRSLHRWMPAALGLLFLWAGLHKLLHPGTATMGLEALDVPHSLASALVAGVTALELYLGALLLLRRDLRYALWLATGLMLVFTGYLWYLSTLADPPSCGCLGLTGIFGNRRQEALFSLLRNCLILWAIKWTYDRHFPRPAAPPGDAAGPVAAPSQSPTA